MKVAVLGAGVVGVATAYYLARDGHEVVLIERRAKAAEEASFGNGGLVSPSDSYAWASPDALRMAVKSLYRSDLGIKYKLRLDPRLWIWSLRFLGQCTNAAAGRNTLVKLRLISYAKDCLNEVVAETGVDYDGLSRGILYYFRSPEGLKAAGHHMGILRDQGLPLETVGRERMLELEPVMARAPDVAGGIYSPDCQTGDSHRFANDLADWCAAEKGTTLLYDTPIRRLVVEGDRVVKAQTDHGDVAADAFVLAAGAESVFLAEAIGIRLPIYPVKGFSITAPLVRPSGPSGAPHGPRRRGPAGGDVAARRAAAGGVLGGLRRLRLRAPAGGLPHDPGDHPPALRRRGRLRRRGPLDRPAPDDPELGADPRPLALPQPPAQRRPRPCRLVDVLRLGQVRGRLPGRPPDRDRRDGTARRLMRLAAGTLGGHPLHVS